MTESGATDALRAAALGIDPATRAFVLPLEEARDARGELESEGLAVAAGASLGAAVARLRGHAPRKGAAPEAIALAARDGLAAGEFRVLWLEPRGPVDDASARAWWMLAVLLMEPGAPDGVLVASLGQEAGRAWGDAAAAARDLVGAIDLVRADGSGDRLARLPKRGARRSPSLLRAAAGLLRGGRSRARSSEAAPPTLAEAALAGALAELPSPAREPLRRALALAQLAGDAALAGACEAALGASAALHGDLAEAAPWLARVRADTLPRRLAAALRDLGLLPEDGPVRARAPRAEIAARQARAGRGALAARLYAGLAADEGESLRSGRTWALAQALAVADARLGASFETLRAAGLGTTTLPPGAAGLSEAIRACASVLASAAPSPASPSLPGWERAAGAALELACQLVPCRSSTLAAGDGRVLAARGAAAIALGRLGAGDGAHVLAVGSSLRLTLARAAEDPPFTRDERRLAGAVADLLSALVPAASPADRTRAPAAPAVAPLDDRLSEVERDALLDALRRHGGNLSRTARALGLSRNGLKMKLARHGLRRAA